MRLIAKQARRAAMGCGVLAATLLLAACGGSEPSSEFHPTRIIAFGDETSSILDIDGNANGHKFSVNGTVSVTDTTIDCRQHPIWIQSLAHAFGTFVFPTCNPAGSAVFQPPNRIRATVGARADDLATQIDAQNAESALRNGDLVTVLVGVNDVLLQYAQYPSVSEVEITANVEAAGTLVGRQVNRLADTGAKVIIATIPDVGYSPFAIAQKLAHIDTDRQELIKRLVEKFNEALKLEIDNDGHKIGLVLLDEAVRQTVNSPGAHGIQNSFLPVCDLSKSQLTPPSILDCTEFTLIINGTGAAFLWADDRHMSYGGQLMLGQLATDRALNNPF
jgi:phospholipase/lecithinase/hemolysin